MKNRSFLRLLASAATLGLLVPKTEDGGGLEPCWRQQMAKKFDQQIKILKQKLIKLCFNV